MWAKEWTVCWLRSHPPLFVLGPEGIVSPLDGLCEGGTGRVPRGWMSDMGFLWCAGDLRGPPRGTQLRGRVLGKRAATIPHAYLFMQKIPSFFLILKVAQLGGARIVTAFGGRFGGIFNPTSPHLGNTCRHSTHVCLRQWFPWQKTGSNLSVSQLEDGHEWGCIWNVAPAA